MKRDPALGSLWHDHHHVLFVAQVLRRATAETLEDARHVFLAYWTSHGRAHLRLEEEILLPAYAAHGDLHHPLIARALCDHVELRHLSEELAGPQTPRAARLHELGARFADHVRFEERELFPLLAHTIPKARLATVALALQDAQRGGLHG